MATGRLILTTSDAGAGHLKQAGIADEVIAVAHRLVSRPAPATADPADFFAARLAAGVAPNDDADDEPLEAWERDHLADALDAAWRQLPARCATFDRIELWPDADPNSQWLLCQLLDRLGRDAALAGRLWLADVDRALGERGAPDPHTASTACLPVEAQALATAQQAWAAFGAGSPRPGAALLGDGWFPYLYSPRRYAASAELIEQTAAQAGRDLAGFEWCAFIFVNVVSWVKS